MKKRKMIKMTKVIRGSRNTITLPECDQARVNALKAQGYK